MSRPPVDEAQERFDMRCRLGLRATGLRRAQGTTPAIRVVVPVVVRNVANGEGRRRHWRERHELEKRVKQGVYLVMKAALRKEGPTPPRGAFVLLVRQYAGHHKPMDDDGLAAALKSTRDGVAAALGVDDGDARVVWLVEQHRAQANAVEISLYWR